MEKICKGEDLNQLKAFFKEYFPQLKEVRVGAIAYGGKPPQMNQHEFKYILELAGIGTKSIKNSVLDTLYYSTNYETEADAFNDSKQLVRYEFFEILVRIAHHLYIREGPLGQSQVTRAVHRLLNDHILNVQNRQILPPWRPFREEQLWCT